MVEEVYVIVFKDFVFGYIDKDIEVVVWFVLYICFVFVG